MGQVFGCLNYEGNPGKNKQASCYNKSMPKWLPVTLIALGLLVFVAKTIPTSPPSHTGYRSCLKETNAYTCLETFFLDLLHRTDAQTTLKILAQADSESPTILSLCHPLVHRLGREAYNVMGDATRAFSVGDETCANGYYHGVLEGYLARSPKLEDAVGSVCKNDGSVSGYIYFQCIHGLGHGLMFKTGDDIGESLKDCDLLKSSYDQQSCYGGVFMQNIVNDFPYNTGHQKAVAKADDPLYPCDDDQVVPDKYKSGCYFLVTSQIVKSTGTDWAAMAGWCDRSPEKYRYLCYQSMGRDVSGATLRDPQKGYAACQTASQGYLADCIQGIAKDLLEYDPQNPTAKVFCDLVDAKYKPACFSALGQMIYSIYTTQNDRAQACRALTKDYLNNCLLVSSI